MAATYPYAKYTPLGMQTQMRMRAHHIICVHTMVGYLTSTDNYFRVKNGDGYRGTESHYGLGGRWGPDLKVPGGLDGAVWQWQDRAYTADANLDGNDVVISVETADNAPVRPEDIERWTAAQVEGLVSLLAWECSPAAHVTCPLDWTCRAAGIPPMLVPDTRPGRRGLAYHRQGIDPWRTSGGTRWSSSKGKACPGDARIAQFITEVVPRVRATVLDSEKAPTPTVFKLSVEAPPLLPPWTLPAGHYYGDVAGPSISHGGFQQSERAIVKLIQQWLIFLGYAPGVASENWRSSWADGEFGPQTISATTAFQRAEMPVTKFYGQIWSDDYARLRSAQSRL